MINVSIIAKLFLLTSHAPVSLIAISFLVPNLLPNSVNEKSK